MRLLHKKHNATRAHLGIPKGKGIYVTATGFEHTTT